MLELDSGVVVDGRYRIDHLVARGGYAEVLRVEHVYLHQPLALKVSKVGQRYTNALFEEAVSLATLEHPGIVRVHDAGCLADGRGFMALEWIEGLSLSRFIARQQLSISEALTVVTAVAEALKVVHDQKLLHRDVKPHNIMIPIIDHRPQLSRVKLIDFGVVDVLRPTAAGAWTNDVGRNAGTPSYSAPEQAIGRRQTIATDVYGLGAVLHELVYGYPPMGDKLRVKRYMLPDESGPITVTLIPERLTSEVPVPDAPLVPDSLRSLICRALLLDADGRFESMESLLASLAAVTGV